MIWLPSAGADGGDVGAAAQKAWLTDVHSLQSMLDGRATAAAEAMSRSMLAC